MLTAMVDRNDHSRSHTRTREPGAGRDEGRDNLIFCVKAHRGQRKPHSRGAAPATMLRFLTAVALNVDASRRCATTAIWSGNVFHPRAEVAHRYGSARHHHEGR
jgi:hypothetical protein